MIRVAGPLAPVLLESWWHGLSGPRWGLPQRPIGAAGLRARLPAPRVGGGDVDFKFVIAPRFESLRSRVFVPLALRRIGS